MPNCHFAEEEFPMTMQIAMVGSDGIVLASDTCWSNTHRGMTSAIRDTSSATKIIQNDVVAIACARDMETSVPIARAIINGMGEKQWEENTKHYIESIAEGVLATAGDRTNIECLIVATRPDLRLFHLASGVTVDKVPTSAYCRDILDKAVAGDTANSAVFWSERYYRRAPIAFLVSLAAQVIIDAGKRHGFISGLEIFLCDGSGIRRLPDDEITDHELQAGKRGRVIGELLFGENEARQ